MTTVIFKSGEQHKIWNEQAQLNGADADAKLKRSCFKRLRRNNTTTTKTYPNPSSPHPHILLTQHTPLLSSTRRTRTLLDLHTPLNPNPTATLVKPYRMVKTVHVSMREERNCRHYQVWLRSLSGQLADAHLLPALRQGDQLEGHKEARLLQVTTPCRV